MANNNPPPPPVLQGYIDIWLLPNEIWTDVLKLLPRRALVQSFSPVCYRLKEICNKNVKSVHVIRKARRFTEQLQRNDPEANIHLWHLAANKCPLASQFQLANEHKYLPFLDFDLPFFLPRSTAAEFVIFEENKAIVRHCPDLFQGCRISLNFKFVEKWAFIEECLTFLEPTNPLDVHISLGVLSSLELLLRHPTIWNCARLKLYWPSTSLSPISLMPDDNARALFDWLHHRPTTKLMHGDDGVAHAQQQHVRHLILSSGNKKFAGIDWLLNRCVQHFKQSRGPGKHHQFVLCFSCQNGQNLLDQFGGRIENHLTGEVLELENPVSNGVRVSGAFCLRRYLAKEAADGKKRKKLSTFKANGGFEFDIEEGEEASIKVKIS